MSVWFVSQVIFNLCCSHLSFFSKCFVRVQEVQPYSSLATAWKTFCFILSERSDFHMVNNLLIAVHALPMHILTLLSGIWTGLLNTFLKEEFIKMSFDLEAKSMYTFNAITYYWINEKTVVKYSQVLCTC